MQRFLLRSSIETICPFALSIGQLADQTTSPLLRLTQLLMVENRTLSSIEISGLCFWPSLALLGFADTSDGRSERQSLALRTLESSLCGKLTLLDGIVGRWHRLPTRRKGFQKVVKRSSHAELVKIGKRMRRIDVWVAPGSRNSSR